MTIDGKPTVRDFLLGPGRSQEPLLVVPEDLPIPSLVEQMTNLSEDRIILVEDIDHRIQGLISLGDLARHLKHTKRSDFYLHSQPPMKRAPYRGELARYSGREILHHVTADTAGEIMKKHIRFCQPDDALSHAIHQMMDGEIIKILPVMNPDGTLAGSLHLRDIMEYLLKTSSPD